MICMRKPIALFIPGLEGGGAQRVFVNLANTLVDMLQHPVHLVVTRDGGIFQDELSPEVTLINLETKRVSRSVLAIVRYLKRHQPCVFMSTMNYSNVFAILAWRMAGRPCRMVVREANVLRDSQRRMRMLMKWTYPQADCVVALSPEVSASILNAGINVENKIVEIGNPGVFAPLGEMLSTPSFLPQLAPRFICAIGSLTYQKGFDVLLSAFSRLENSSLHLVILGEGPLRSDLEEQARKLGVGARVHMPGFIKQPLDVVRQSEVFVLSSRWEGFPNVLLEALSAGVPIVSTDCDGAPGSMLEKGRYGHLVNVEDPVALYEGIKLALNEPISTAEERRARADDFSAKKITKIYIDKAFMV